MSDRLFSVTLTDDDWATITEILSSKESSMRSLAKKTVRSGYGKVTTIAKADTWSAKADDLSIIIQKINAEAT